MNKQQPDFSIPDTFAHCLCVYQVSNFLGLIVPEKSVTKNLMFENWRERKWNNGTNKQQQPDSGIHDISAHCPRVYLPSFNLLGLTVRENSVMKIFNVWKLERKKEIKGQISSSLIPVYTIHLPTIHLWPSFSLLDLTVPENWRERKMKCDEHFNVWKLERKKNEIKGQISSSLYTW